MTGELSLDEYDRREQKHRHDLEIRQAQVDRDIAVARENRKATTRRAFGYVGVALVAAGCVVSIALIIHKATSGPDENKNREQEREQACVENGGGYVPESLLRDTASQGVCVYPGRKVSVQ